MASMIGKESGNGDEKPLISAVFHNRLKRKCVCKVIRLPYMTWKILKECERRHLKRNSPYNTYVIKGLPPGPIANPGLDSLKAALYPAPVNYLYFVSQRDGSHFFSTSLAEHNQAIARYRYIKNE